MDFRTHGHRPSTIASMTQMKDLIIVFFISIPPALCWWTYNRTIRRFASAENGLKTSCRATKKDRLACPFDQWRMSEVSLAGQDISLPGNPHRFGPGPNSQVPVEILHVELDGAKAQEQPICDLLVAVS